MQFQGAINREHHRCKSTMIICNRHTLCSYIHCWCDIYFRHVCMLAWLLLSAWLCVYKSSCLPVGMSECLWACMTACLHCCMSVCLHDCLAVLGQIQELFALGGSFQPSKTEMKMFNHEPFLMKNFGGQTSLYTIHILKNDCDEKKKNIVFLVLNALLIPFLKKLKRDF